MILIENNDLIIKCLRLRRIDPIGEYNFFLHFKMGNGFYNLTVEDTGDENTMVFVIPASFTSTLPCGEYAYSIVKDSQVVTSGVARKRELNFEADAVYSGTGDERTFYNVSIFASQGGYLMVNGRRYQDYTQSVPEGQILAVQAVSEAGYTFNGWSDEVQDAERTILVSQDITLFATYEAAEYTVSISAGSNGSVSVNGVVGDYTATLAYGTVLTIEAEADTDYEFGQWSDGNTDNPRTVTVTGPVALAAEFQEAVQYFNVSIAAGANGSVSVNGTPGDYSQSVAEGTVLTLVATPDEGYSFTGWSDSNTDNPRTLTVTGNVSLTSAYEEAIQYFNVSISAGQNGMVSVNGTPGNYSQTVAEGTVLTVQAIPNTGYNFTSWSDGNSDNPRTLTVTGDITLTSSYEEAVQYYNVSVSAGSNGSVSVNGVVGDYSQTVIEGTLLTIEANPETGYDFTQWSDGVSTASRTIVVDSNIAISASFAVQTFQVSITAGSNGSVSVNGTPGNYTQTVNYGTVLTLEATPSTGYGFTAWSDGNTDNPRTITVTAPVSLASAYAAETYVVSIASEDTDEGNVIVNGVQGDYSQTVSYGTQITLSVSPAQHYDFVMWSDGVVSENRTVTVTGPLTLTAVFVVESFNVTISAGQNGTVTVNGVTGDYQATVPYNTQLTVSATADTGYDFNQWSDGSSTASRTIYVTSDVSLIASFAVQTFQVSITAGSNGSVSVNGTPGNYSQTVNYGTVLTLEATPSTGYSFTAWSDGNTSNPRTLTVTAPVSLTSAFQAQVQPSELNTIRYTTTDGQVNTDWVYAFDKDNNTMTPIDTTYGRLVYDRPVVEMYIRSANAGNISSITTGYMVKLIEVYDTLTNLSNCTRLILKSPQIQGVVFSVFPNLQYLEAWYANDDAVFIGLGHLPNSGTCVTRTDNNLWEHSDISGWTFQALGTVITYEAQQTMDLTDHNVNNRHTEGVQPASHTFADGVGTITYDETVGELRDNWDGCDKLYIPDTVGYFDGCEYLPQAMEVGEYFGVVGGSMYAVEDWNYTQLFSDGIKPDTAVTVGQDNPILTIGTDGCLYYKEDWTGLNVVNQTVTNSTVALLDMDDRCVDASTCMFDRISSDDLLTITRLVLGDSCESLKLYAPYGGLLIGELVLNDALQTINPSKQRIGHASGGSNNPYLNVTNSGYTIESEDGTTLYWCGDASADLSDYTHFAESCCAYLSFSSMPDISSATQVDRDAFHNVSGVGTWVWPDNNIVFNGRHIIRNTGSMTRIEFGSHSVTFNNNEGEGLFECWNLNTMVFNSQLIPTQVYQNDEVFQELPSVGTVYIPLGSDYTTFLNYPGNVNNIGQWTVKYIMSNTQLAIRHTPGVTISVPTLTGLTMVASADSNGRLKVTYSGNITAYDSTDLQNNTDVLEVVLPDSCLSVGNGAFLGCSGLTKVTAYGLTSVGNSAFYGTAITEFSAKGVTSFGSGAFGGCTSLVSVEFGENLATLGNGLFYNCSSLEYVGFEGVTGPTITNNDLGSGIHATGTIYIPRYANNASYADFIAAMPSGWTVIRRKQNQIIYQTTNGLKLDDVPNTLGGAPLTRHTYANGWGVIEYVGDSINYIDGWRFARRDTLSYVSIPALEQGIEENAFGACTALTTVELQGCGGDIGYDAFRFCPIANGPDTGKLTLPPNVGYILGGAFDSLASSVIEFGPALQSIDADTFNLQNATDLYVYTTHTMEDHGNPFMNTPATGTLHMVPGADVPYWTQYLPGWTVYTDNSLITYTSSDSRKVEPKDSVFKDRYDNVIPLAYNYCDSNGNGILGIQGRLAKIGGSAFANTNIETVTIPNTVTDVSSSAFNYTNLASIKIKDGPDGNSTLSDDTYYTKYNGSEKNALFKRTNINVDPYRMDSIIVGTANVSLDFPNVFRINPMAYKGNNALTRFRFGSCINFIYSEAFMDCSQLSRIYLKTYMAPSEFSTDVFSGVASVGTVYGTSGIDYSPIMALLPSGWTLSQS